MSDTDRPGPSPEAGAAKSKPRRGRAASATESARAGEGASRAPGEAEVRRDSRSETPAVGTSPEASRGASIEAAPPEREALRAGPSVQGPDQEGREEPAGDTAAPISHKKEPAPPPDGAPPRRLNAPRPPPEEKASSPWRHVGEKASLPSSPAPGARTARTLATAALVLSLLLPGALYVYLAASGILDRDPERLARAENAIEALRATSAPKQEVARADLDKIAARIDALEKAVAAQGQRPATASLDALSARIDAASRDAKEALSTAKSAADTTNGAQPAASRLAALESRVVALDKQVATLEQSVTARPKQDVNAPSILVMARAIEADLNRGVPYEGELDALSRLGADAKLVDALRPFAERGAPSPASLASDFENELEAAREKVAETTQPANWWDRLMYVLNRIVRVRHIGADETGTPAGSVEAALLRGDVRAARDAWDVLPVFEKSSTPHSGARIKALAEAYAASRQISTAALEVIRHSSGADNGG